ncbi:unnamed protein product [Linum tenue]|uniref:Peptidase A1 domain-containing protein n=1 Tax=Linum tenue TaxID=586396 RepID=A0AAV0IQQ9_9ROSI|nr:unnamed protein product [Linum tenue]
MVPLNSSVVAVEHHKARDRARHARLFSGLVNFSVYGSADSFYYGIYFTKVKLGTPAREFNLQIDTGSDLTWLNSKSCPTCPRSSRFGIELNPYEAAASSTSKPISCSDKICAAVAPRNASRCPRNDQLCGYALEYMDGATTSGNYMADTFHFESIPSGSTTPNASAAILFGVSTYRSGVLAETTLAVDGIFGFGKGNLSVLSQLYYRGITPRVFSHCLKGEGTGGGVFVLGEITAPRMVYTPLVPSQPHYSLHLESIAVDGQTVPVDPRAFTPSADRATFIDTGTTLSYLVEEAYDPFVHSVNAAVSKFGTPRMKNGYLCYPISSSICSLFPPVSLNFVGGASMLLKPEQYLVLYDVMTQDGSMWCIGFRKLQGLTILGDLVIKDKIFVYDLVRQRVGWVDYDCSSSMNTSVSSEEFFNPKQSSSSSSSRDLLFQLLTIAIVTAFLSI